MKATTLDFSITRQGNPTPPPLTDVPFRGAVVPAGEFYIVRHDFETRDWGYQPRAYSITGWKPQVNPEGHFPDTAPLEGCGPSEFTPLPEKWQWFWYELMKRACAYRIPSNEMIERWRDATTDGRALTDKHTWNWVKAGEKKLFADFVQGLNLDSPYGPMQIKCLTMGGNLLHVLDSDVRGNYIIEALDIDQEPPAVDEVWNTPWLVHWGTQSSIVASGTGFRVVDWPQLNWDGVAYGVPFPLVGRGGINKIPKSWTKRAVTGAMWSPYV